MSADEDPFELIKKGNSFEAASDYWRSAEYYGRSSICLRCRADALATQLCNGDGSRSGVAGIGIDGGGVRDKHSTKLENQRIISLYRAQSLEYMYKARHSLLEAMRFENEQDRSRTLEVAKSGSGSLDPVCSMISSVDRTKRNRIFQLLFSGRCEVLDVGTQSDSLLIEQDRAPNRMNHTASGNALNSSNSVAKDGAVPVANDLSIQQQQGGPLLSATQAQSKKESSTMHGHCPNYSVSTGSSQIHSTEKCSTSSLSTPIVDETDYRQQSIETRLAKLDSSLIPKAPYHHKSCSLSGGEDDSNKRVNEIKRGLERLGVSLPDSTRKRELVHKHVTTRDQVKLILEQATDEVRVERGTHMDDGGYSNEYADEHTYNNDDGVDENDSMFEGFENEEFDVDALLTMAENLVTKSGVEIVGKGGMYSSELLHIKKIQALLLEARLCLEMDLCPKDGDKQSKDVSGNEQGTVENLEGATATKTKAVGLIQNAHTCMQEFLRHFR